MTRNSSQKPDATATGKVERIRMRLLLPMALAICLLMAAFLFAFHQDQKKRSAQDVDRASHEVNKEDLND